MKVMLASALILSLIVLSRCEGKEEELGADVPSLAEEYVDYIKGGEAEQGQDNEESNERGEEGGQTNPSDSLLRAFRKQFDDMSEADTTQKLAQILKDIDTDNDSAISPSELEEFVVQEGEKVSAEEDTNDLGFSEIDANKDGKLTWEEILHDLNNPVQSNQAKLTPKEEESEKLKFGHADVDKDQFLTEAEFRRYAMPEFFRSMSEYMVKNLLLNFDLDKDGKVSRDEFSKSTGVTPDEIANAQDRFDSFDTNKDGFYTGDELKSVALEYGVESLGKQETETLMGQLDKNKDGKLSIEEVLKNHDVLTVSAPEAKGDEFNTDSGEDREGEDDGEKDEDEKDPEEKEEPEEGEDDEEDESAGNEESDNDDAKKTEDSTKKDEL